MKIIYFIFFFKIILVSKVLAEKTGCVKGVCNSSNSYGTWVYDNGDTYVGEWSYGRRDGKGVYTYSDGDTYDGEWVNNKFQGKGVYTYSDGTKVEGIWKDDEITILCRKGNCKNGKGVLEKIGLLNDKDNTWIYRGDLLNYEFHGRGILSFKTGDKYVGEFKSNKNHGEGTITYASGKTFQGSFFEGKRDGEAIITFPDGKTENRYYKRGQRIYAVKSKKDLQDHIDNHRIKKDIKLKCMLTETDSYDYKPSVYNQFYLTLDKTNNQIIASGFVEKWGAFNITYDEINYNRDETIVANTIKIYRGNKTHMRLVLDKYTGDLKVLNDIDYKNEGIEKSLDAKIRGGVSNGYVWSGLGHAADCKEKIF